jgi:hypothetical protein
MTGLRKALGPRRSVEYRPGYIPVYRLVPSHPEVTAADLHGPQYWENQRRIANCLRCGKSIPALPFCTKCLRRSLIQKQQWFRSIFGE